LKVTKIPYKLTNQFSNLVIDYIEKDPKLKEFISKFPSLNNFGKQIKYKENHIIDRSLLVDVLKSQNSNLVLSINTQNNIEHLLNKKTFTVTTGHQLCFFTGPIYFFYKIISTINLVEKLRETYPKNNFVPVFWMASEDHDFEEINHFNFFKKTITWQTNQKGMVGNMKISEISNIIEHLKSTFGKCDNAQKLISLIENAYKENTLSYATRFLINELFGSYGIVIIDGDDKSLKNKFIPIIKKDLIHKGFYKSIKNCSLKLKENYKLQARIRERNFFRLLNNSRLRIDELVDEDDINKKAYSFSPNVLLRPLYQEMILPNISYVGGGAEIAYWMQLKSLFNQEKIPMPILVLRSSIMILNIKQQNRLNSLGLKITDLFLKEDQIKSKYIKSRSNIDASFLKEASRIKDVYNQISNKINDASLKQSVASNLQFQYNFLKKLEKKIMKIEKSKHEIFLNQISNLKKDLFPNNNLQERFYNFSSFYIDQGDKFIKRLKDNINPLSSNFVVLTTKEE